MIAKISKILPKLKPKLLEKKQDLFFKTPYSSLNPKMKIKEILTEPLIVHNVQNKKTPDCNA